MTPYPQIHRGTLQKNNKTLLKRNKTCYTYSMKIQNIIDMQQLDFELKQMLQEKEDCKKRTAVLRSQIARMRHLKKSIEELK